MMNDNDKSYGDSPIELGFTALPVDDEPVNYELALLSTLDEIESSLSNAQQIVESIAEECVRACESVTGGCQDCLVGSAVRYLEQSEAIHGKLHTKLINSLASLITDSQQALNTVDEIASFLQQGGSDGSNRDEPVMDVKTIEQLNYQAEMSGKIYRGEADPSESQVFYANRDEPPGTGDNPCEPGTILTCNQGGDLIYKDGEPVCVIPTTGESYSPTCETGPGGGGGGPGGPGDNPPICVEISELACPDVPNIQLCLNGQPVDLETAAAYCSAKSCCTTVPTTCGEVVSCFNDYQAILSGEVEEEEEGEEGAACGQEEKCKLFSANDILESQLGVVSGVIGYCGEQLATESSPIKILDPDNKNCKVDAKIGTPDPSGKCVTDKQLDSNELFAQALRNNGKVQVCDFRNPLTGVITVENGITDWDFCHPDSHDLAKKALDPFLETAKTIDREGPSGAIAGTAAIYGLLTGNSDNVPVADSAVFASISASIYAKCFTSFASAQFFNNVYPHVDGCDHDTYNASVLMREINNVSQSFGAYDNPVMRQSHKYLSNYACQYILPSCSDFDLMYLKGRVDRDQWTFGQKIHAMCPDWQEKLVDASRPTPSFQVVFGWHQANMITEEERDKLLRRTGIDCKEDIENFKLVAEQLPPPSDLIRMMVRDVADDKIVEKYHYQDDFEKKWDGKLKDFADRQNISEDVARLYWSAHWALPSPTQAYEMFHRLRPEKGLKDKDGKELSFTKEDLIEFLKISDVAPAFAEKMIEINYRTPGIRQIARAYETDNITLKDAYGYYLDLGYDKPVAKTLADYLAVDGAERRAKFLGKPLPSVMEKYYIDGVIGEEVYTNALYDAGFPQNVVDERVRRGRVKAAVQDGMIRVKAVQKRYLRGDISDIEYRNKLLDIGLDAERVDGIVRRDQDVKISKNKELTIAKNCKLVKQGLLTPQQFFQRALNFGFDLDNASLLVQSCIQDVIEEQQNRLRAEIRAALADAAKAQAAAERAAKKAERDRLAAMPCKPKTKPVCP